MSGRNSGRSPWLSKEAQIRATGMIAGEVDASEMGARTTSNFSGCFRRGKRNCDEIKEPKWVMCRKHQFEEEVAVAEIQRRQQD